MSFVLSRNWDKEKIICGDAIDIPGPSSMQDAWHMNFVIESLWLSDGALKVWSSIPHGDSEVFLCPTLVTRRKTSFSISLPRSKLTISPIIFTVHIYHISENIQESLYSFSLVNIYNKKSNYRPLTNWNLRIHWNLHPNIDNGCLSCINKEIMKLVI